MINSARLIECIEEAGFEARSYSGRGMFGKNCVGVELERGTSSFELAAKICNAALEILEEEEARDLIDELTHLRACKDNMGSDSITYWPGAAWVKTIEEEEEEDVPTHDHTGRELAPVEK